MNRKKDIYQDSLFVFPSKKRKSKKSVKYIKPKYVDEKLKHLDFTIKVTE